MSFEGFTFMCRDHAGGNNGMKKLLKDVPIYGGVKDKVEACSHPVQHGDEFSISPTIRVKCLETPWWVVLCCCLHCDSTSAFKRINILVMHIILE